MPDLMAGAVPPGRPSIRHRRLSRDVSRVVSGGQIVSVAAWRPLAVAAALVGGLAGFYGGWLDGLMRAVDGAPRHPRLFLLLLLVAWADALGRWMVLGATGWFATSRIDREVLRLARRVRPRRRGAGRPGRFLGPAPNVAGPILVAAHSRGDVILPS
jgi:hypothetical protein